MHARIYLRNQQGLTFIYPLIMLVILMIVLLYTISAIKMPSGRYDVRSRADLVEKPGDLTGDGQVNILDLSVLLSEWGK